MLDLPETFLSSFFNKFTFKNLSVSSPYDTVFSNETKGLKNSGLNLMYVDLKNQNSLVLPLVEKVYSC